MFQIMKADKVIDFMRWSKVTFVLSIIMIIAAIGTVTTQKLNWGLDFTGGTLIEVGFEQPADLAKIRDSLENAGFGDAIVQTSVRHVMSWFVCSRVKMQRVRSWVTRLSMP